jgi:hypothetical protein
VKATAAVAAEIAVAPAAAAITTITVTLHSAAAMAPYVAPATSAPSAIAAAHGNDRNSQTAADDTAGFVTTA